MFSTDSYDISFTILLITLTSHTKTKLLTFSCPKSVKVNERLQSYLILYRFTKSFVYSTVNKFEDTKNFVVGMGSTAYYLVFYQEIHF